MISTPSDKKLFLLDAYALIFRAYYAFIKNPRINSKGLNTSAMYGFTNVLLDVLQHEKPSHLAVVFDPHGPTVREEEYEAYKANRDETPEDIKLAFPYIIKIIKAMNIAVYQVDKYEADDIIGTLAKKAEQHGFETYMMTSDKDYGQLVTDKIKIFRPGRGGNEAEVLGPREVCEKFGISNVEQVIDLLGMMGDAVDNIPGIPGVGEKTAVKFLQEFGSLEGLLANTDKLKGKQKENVEANVELARLSRKLATIIIDAPVEWNESEMMVQPPNASALEEVFSELEFRTLSKRVFNNAPARQEIQGSLFPEESSLENPTNLSTLKTVEHDYRLVSSSEQRKMLIAELERATVFSFDTETSDLDAHEAFLVGMSFCIQPHVAFYVPLPREFSECQSVLSEFIPIFHDTSKVLVAQNFKFDLKFLKKHGLHVRNRVFDTMVAHYLLHPDGKHGMDEMSRNYLQYVPISIEELIGKKGKSQGSMDRLPPEKICDYAAEDADVTLQLKNIFEEKLHEENLTSVFENIEMPLIDVLADMELEGIRIDSHFLNDYSKILGDDIVKLESEIFEMSGERFNIDSPKQLGQLLFEKMKISPDAKKTKTGQYSTDESTLQKFEKEVPLIAKILDYRELRKLKSTYVDALPELVSKVTGRVHTHFSQVTAATGRLASNNPNLQNIPIRTERGREIRKAFVPRDEHHVLLSADYSQIELRIIASLSADANMCEAFLQGGDIHRATASKVFGVNPDEVSKEMRARAKAVNFGIIYGQGAFGLAQNLGISRTEAKQIIDAYFVQFHRLKEYQQEVIAGARTKGFVETIAGRKRYLPDIQSANAVVRSFAERNAINAPVQGSAADLIKLAMIRIHQELMNSGMKSRMVLQVHDELIFDVPREELDSLSAMVTRSMQEAMKLQVPLVADYGSGDNWLAAH